MSAYERLFRWLHEHKAKHCELPHTIPVTRAEVVEVARECAPHQDVALSPSSKLFGIDCDTHDFAPAIRERRLAVPIEYLMSEYRIDDSLLHNTEAAIRECLGYQYRTLRAQILCDRTRVKVLLEYDPWAWIKRLLRAPSWFPGRNWLKIRFHEVEIDCAVLYPYCKVQLPHNRHTFQCRPISRPCL